MSPIKVYHGYLKSHFLLVQCVQTAVLMGLGDILSQRFVEKKSWKEYHVRRTVEFAFLGGCLVGPAVTAWYRLLQKQFGTEKNAATTLKKVAADQLLFAPGFLIIFLTSLGLLHGENTKQIQEDIQNEYVDIVTTNWKVWPAVQLVNFYFLPLRYQVLFVQSVAIFWNTYLSWKTQGHSSLKKVKS